MFEKVVPAISDKYASKYYTQARDVAALAETGLPFAVRPHPRPAG
ncbi:hypothetical protein [Streptomyces sp. NPDC058542]